MPVPELCRFLGIVIAMFYREHGPAHFHAVYGEFDITVEIETGIVNGKFPKRALTPFSSGMGCIKRNSWTIGT
jgi:hypothetical protein